MGVMELGPDTLKSSKELGEWSKKKVYKGKSFRELFTYDGASVWWFLYWLIRGSKYTPYSMQGVFRAEREGKLDGLGDNLGWRLFRSRRNMDLMNLRFWLRGFLERGSTRGWGRPREPGKPRVLILGKNIDVRKMRDPETGREITANVYLEPVIRVLEKRGFDLVKVERRYGFGNRRGRNSEDWIAFESYEPSGWSSLVREGSNKLEALWDEARLHFKGSFIVDGKDLSDYLIASLDVMFEKRIPQVVRIIEGMKNMLRTEKPDAVLFLSDAKDAERALIIAARKMGIPVLGLAHAGFTKFSYPYQYAPGDIPPDSSVEAPFAPVPDVFMVYGPKHKKVLASWNWPVEIIKVTGQPRYDVLGRANEIYDKDETRNKLGILDEKKFVLMTTASHGISLDEHIITLRESYKAAKELSDEIILIIKLHPNEKKDKKKIRMYGETANEVGFEPRILYDYDALELIYACDLLLQNHSTTAIEAVLMGKPVISMNFTEEDTIGIVERGASIEVKRESELHEAIRKALYDEVVWKRLAAGRDRVVYDFTYKLDGKASDRVCECIEKVIGSRG